MGNEIKQMLEFGPFRIDPKQRQLLRDQQPVLLPPKTFDLLLVLVQHSGQVVLKDDLMKALWPDTFVEESNLGQHVFQLRRALADKSGDSSQYIVTVPGRGYRFAHSVNLLPQEEELIMERHTRTRVVIEEQQTTAISPAPAATISGSPPSRPGGKQSRWILAAVALLAIAGSIAWRLRRPPPLKEADLVLVSDFVNATGEPVFDDTLRQALTVKMAESPFFNVVLDAQTRRTLGLMKKSADERVVGPLAREVCQREGAKALIGGSIVHLGNKYVLDLNALNCLTGASLAQQRIEADDQEQVLRQLGRAIAPIRKMLGESVNSIEKFNTPIEQATTTSLSALKAYTEGDLRRAHSEDDQSIAFYKAAIDLDPEFAIAYARLGAIYRNAQEDELSREYLRKAFERREHISEREKLYIQAHYYEDATGEIDKAIETYELWTKVYPHDWIPFNNLSNETFKIGDIDRAIAAAQQALRLNPNHSYPYGSLANAYFNATRFAEAKAICEKAAAAKLDGWQTHYRLYVIALMEEDQTAQERERDWFKGNPLANWIMVADGEYAISRGRVHEAVQRLEQARLDARQHGMKERAAAIAQSLAQNEADLGYETDARSLANAAVLEMQDPTQKADTALTLAGAGDLKRAQILAGEASDNKPLDLVMNKVTLACVWATFKMKKGDAVGAIQELRPAVPYDFSDHGQGISSYYRGYAFLQAHSGKNAADEFQKILDHRGAAVFYWPLAHLGLARAYGLTGDKDKSLALYREFFELWKGADADVPLVKEARAEYAKLQLVSGL
jgi:eukaryotic-like serine/threonine-protein kinase